MTNMEVICFCSIMILLAFIVFRSVRRNSNGAGKQAARSGGRSGMEEAGERAVNPMVRNCGQKYGPVPSGRRVNPMVRGAEENRERP